METLFFDINHMGEGDMKNALHSLEGERGLFLIISLA
jgi:hypothetical protein